MAVKLCKFAKRVAKKRAVGKSAVESEAQRRTRTNKIPTMKEARDFAQKVANGAAKHPTTKPFMVAIMPQVSLLQPTPYKAATHKK